jgi:hypothetical protein
VVAKGEFNGKITVSDDHQCVIPAEHFADEEEEMSRVGTTRWCPVQASAAVTSRIARSAVRSGGGGGGGDGGTAEQQHGAQGPECDVSSFLAAAQKVQPSLLVDELMATLHCHQYDTARALDALTQEVQASARARSTTQQRESLAGGASASVSAAGTTTAPQHVNVVDVESLSLDSWADGEKTVFTDAVFKYGKDFSKIQRRVLPSRTVPQLILYYYLRWKGTPQFFQWQEQSFNQTNEDECAAPSCPWGGNGGGGGGGGGGLLCCDGCPQAFHFSCCEPKPLSVLSLTGRQWYCPKCTASRRRWGRDLVPCSDDPARHDCPPGPRGASGQIRLLNDTKMMPPAPVMQYKSLSCNPRCKHCTHLLAGGSCGKTGSGGGGGSVAIVADGGGRRRSGRQAAVADVNVFRGAGLHVHIKAVNLSEQPTASSASGSGSASAGTGSESDSGAGSGSDNDSDNGDNSGGNEEHVMMMSADAYENAKESEEDEEGDEDNDDDDDNNHAGSLHDSDTESQGRVESKGKGKGKSKGKGKGDDNDGGGGESSSEGEGEGPRRERKRRRL